MWVELGGGWGHLGLEEWGGKLRMLSSDWGKVESEWTAWIRDGHHTRHRHTNWSSKREELAQYMCRGKVLTAFWSPKQPDWRSLEELIWDHCLPNCGLRIHIESNLTTLVIRYSVYKPTDEFNKLWQSKKNCLITLTCILHICSALLLAYPKSEVENWFIRLSS